MLKPDTHEDILGGMVIRDIEDGGLKVIFRKDLVLNQERAELIYSEHKESPNMRHAVKSLLGDDKNNFTTLLIIKSLDGGDALKKMQALKGRSDLRGIRFKYRRIVGEEFTGERREDELLKNRLHVPDSNVLASEIINDLLDKSEIEEIRQREPELFREAFIEHHELVKINPENNGFKIK
ncbi:MAG: nucleoside-diphosphate kinase [Patescibacteria group bacterium]